jgi:hypothetical protein
LVAITATAGPPSTLTQPLSVPRRQTPMTWPGVAPLPSVKTTSSTAPSAPCACTRLVVVPLKKMTAPFPSTHSTFPPLVALLRVPQVSSFVFAVSCRTCDCPAATRLA